MREYETIFVLEPNQDEASVEAEIEKIRDLITSGGGEIAAIEKVDPKAFRPEPSPAAPVYQAEDDC